MNQRPRPARGQQQQRSQGRGRPRVDLWKPAANLPRPAPVAPTNAPSTLVRSLGAPPLHRDDVGNYIETAVERAALMANALLASAGLLAVPAPDED